MSDLAGRLKNRVQITSDGHKPYIEAVENAFGSEVDFALLVKMYGNDHPDSGKKRAVCVGTQTQVVAGNPNHRLISTSLIERQNLRMSNRRFTRKTNGFSKKLRNLEYSNPALCVLQLCANPPNPASDAGPWNLGWPVTCGKWRKSSRW
jgi:hypothetical protein